ncbi:hypothetical protein [uncultured Desulfovibrio sp.]|uniref:hypothetical protein n=1 Tax=uncultured Desulfovibrio sp. TaxID=167968 RepID=UPI0026221DA1|nr:hypothetical protein [uncultured Desulfovibrio sp.]
MPETAGIGRCRPGAAVPAQGNERPLTRREWRQAADGIEAGDIHWQSVHEET